LGSVVGSFELGGRDVAAVAVEAFVVDQWTHDSVASSSSSTSSHGRGASGRTHSASVICLVGALLVEINDQMVAAERRYIAAASVAELTTNPDELALPAAPRT